MASLESLSGIVSSLTPLVHCVLVLLLGLPRVAWGKESGRGGRQKGKEKAGKRSTVKEKRKSGTTIRVM